MSDIILNITVGGFGDKSFAFVEIDEKRLTTLELSQVIDKACEFELRLDRTSRCVKEFKINGTPYPLP